jgi:hypothetical protein
VGPCRHLEIPLAGGFIDVKLGARMPSSGFIADQRHLTAVGIAIGGILRLLYSYIYAWIPGPEGPSRRPRELSIKTNNEGGRPRTT